MITVATVSYHTKIGISIITLITLSNRTNYSKIINQSIDFNQSREKNDKDTPQFLYSIGIGNGSVKLAVVALLFLLSFLQPWSVEDR